MPSFSSAGLLVIIVNFRAIFTNKGQCSEHLDKTAQWGKAELSFTFSRFAAWFHFHWLHSVDEPKKSLTLLTTVTRSTARDKKSVKIRTWRVEEKETKIMRRGKRGQWLVRTIMTSRDDVSLSNSQGDVWWQIFLKQRRHKLSWKRNEKLEKVFK